MNADQLKTTKVTITIEDGTQSNTIIIDKVLSINFDTVYDEKFDIEDGPINYYEKIKEIVMSLTPLRGDDGKYLIQQHKNVVKEQQENRVEDIKHKVPVEVVNYHGAVAPGFGMIITSDDESPIYYHRATYRLKKHNKLYAACRCPKRYEHVLDELTYSDVVTFTDFAHRMLSITLPE